jgi:hypothetical protein
LSAYHIYGLYRVRRAPLQTYAGITKYLRHIWVASIMKEKRDILSVQTLRNEERLKGRVQGLEGTVQFRHLDFIKPFG